MEKPLSIKREEFGQALVNLVNNCGLPAFVCADMLRQITAEAENLAMRQLQNDRAVWEKEQEGKDDA